MRRRTLLTRLLALPALALPAMTLAACDHLRMPGDFEIGLGDSLFSAALDAPWQFGDLARWHGQPAEAALAVASLELLADGLPRSPYYSPAFSVTVIVQLQQGRAEVRQALGIARNAAPDAVIAALDEAAAALQAGNRAAAVAVLDRAPGFTLGGAETLRRLGDLPPLPRAGEAAQAVFAEMMRFEP